jgi:hypothetical protein
MAHWAEIDENNIVLRVTVGDNDDPVGDEGYQWLIDNVGGTWVKTSYNAVGGKKRDPETGEITEESGFRKNFAGIGFTYDSVRDAFIPPMPPTTVPDLENVGVTKEVTWSLNEDTCLWEMVSE